MATDHHEVSSNEVNFHVDQAHSREPSSNGHNHLSLAPTATTTNNNETARRELDRERFDAHHPTTAATTTSAPMANLSHPAGGYEQPMTRSPMPGYENDLLYGTNRDRAKIEGGPGAHYDDKEQKFQNDLPSETLGERLFHGVFNPTNLTAGERPMKGKTSSGISNYEETSYEKVSSLADPKLSWWPHFLSWPFGWYPYNVNLNAYRLGQMCVLAICIMGTERRHERWLWYVTLALTVDYLCRMLAGPRASIVTLIGEMIDSLLSMCTFRKAGRGLFPRSWVAGAPYQFSDFCIGCLLTAATICFFQGQDDGDDDGDTAGAVVLGVVALISFIEFVFGLPIFVWFFNQMIHFGWIWKDCEIKSAMIRDQYQRRNHQREIRMAAAAAELKANRSDQKQSRRFLFAGRTNEDGTARRALPYAYDNAHEYHKRHEWNPIKHIKVSYFLNSAGVTALAWVWAMSDDIFDTPALVWKILVIAGMVMFSFNFVLYLLKILFYPHYVRYEWEHPLYRSLFLVVPLNWLMFIPLIVREYDALAETVFWIGAPLLLFGSIVQMAYYFHQAHFFENFNASWLIVPTANAIAAFMLPLVHANYTEVAWLWLGISVFMWVIISTLVFLKGAMYPRFHDAFRYSIWLMMGCASAIAIAAISINTGTDDLSTPIWSQLAIATFYIGLVLFLVFLFKAMIGYFGRSAFSNLWWIPAIAMCFLTISTILYHGLHRTSTTRGVATTAMVLTNIACALFFLNTLRLLLTRKFFRPDRLQLSPLEFFRLPNEALRSALYELQAHIDNPKATAEEWRYFETVLFPSYVLTSYAFNYLKQESLYPVMSAWFGVNCYSSIDENAKALDIALTAIHERILRSQQMPINSVERTAEESAIRKEFATFVASATANFDEEEIYIHGLARRYIGAKEANGMIHKSWEDIHPTQWSVILPFVVHHLHDDGQRVRFLHCLASAAPEHFQLIGKLIYEGADPFLWDRLVIDMPEMRPRMTRGYTRIW